MKLLIAIVLSLCASGLLVDDADSISCARYICKNDFTDKSICYKSESTSEVYLHKCSDEKQICDMFSMQGGEAHCSPYYSGRKLLPGEYCTHDEECRSAACNSTAAVCQGKPEKDKCSTDEDCHAGLYCVVTGTEESRCARTVRKGEKCGESLKCAWNLVCRIEKCVEIGSEPNGNSATFPEECASFHVENDKCSAGPKFLEKKLIDNEYLCFYRRSDGKEFNLTAKCGRNEEGAKHCNLGRGDVDMSPVSFWL
eukprot:TRINITY_DN9647_c0_g1_i6.p1 TRINITY_DN9647_c0_g1~~TRINITY_DN9647_c0_g1_i6.p1  ORF type:complete len:254 (-),score=35.45 TRINITY_DN9647_c0_g1_i6:571-1332(-)